jgi:hypothetical protein
MQNGPGKTLARFGVVGAVLQQEVARTQETLMGRGIARLFRWHVFSPFGSEQESTVAKNDFTDVAILRPGLCQKIADDARRC